MQRRDTERSGEWGRSGSKSICKRNRGRARLQAVDTIRNGAEIVEGD